MKIPSQVTELISCLEHAGYPAYVVGGCVRDALLNRAPKDWDVTTLARPEQLTQIFAAYPCSEKGLVHGTLVVFIDEEGYEITTFRADGEYTDHRHPDSVIFVDDIKEDLRRRDFTINAMAYSPIYGLVDPFGGQEDLKRGLIRCVGISRKRFTEDAFRIMRALRFAAVYDFTFDEETAEGIHALAPTLKSISGDRKRTELMKLLCGKGAGRILREFADVFSIIVPEIAVMVGYDQCNHHHKYDLWEHTVRAVENVPADPVLRLVMLLHDTGKPSSRTVDEKGEAHFKGHPEVSAKIAQRVMEELSFDRITAGRVCSLVTNHDLLMQLNENKTDEIRSFLRKRLQTLGAENLRDIITVNRADRIATGTRTVEQVDVWTQKLNMILDELLAEKPAFSKNDLALTGNDLIALGLRGAEIGKTQQMLLAMIADGMVKNEREELKKAIEGRKD